MPAMYGHKLTGLVGLGKHESYEPPQCKVFHSPLVRITNPNPNLLLENLHLYILRSPVNPPLPGMSTEIYDGDFLAIAYPPTPATMVPVSELTPHQTVECPLYLIPAVGPTTQDYALYVVEITWMAPAAGGLPLVGFQREITRYDYHGILFTETESPLEHQVFYCPVFW